METKFIFTNYDNCHHVESYFISKKTKLVERSQQNQEWEKNRPEKINSSLAYKGSFITKRRMKYLKQYERITNSRFKRNANQFDYETQCIVNRMFVEAISSK